MTMSTAPVPSLHETPLSQAQSGPSTRHERPEHACGMVFLAVIVRGPKRPRFTPFKGSRRVLPGLLSGPDQPHLRRRDESRLIERT